MMISGTIPGSVVDGPGYNYVIFMQGCSHQCKGCHNPETWDFKGGYNIDIEELHHEIVNNIFTGVTFSGGDPMDVIAKMKTKEFDKFVVFIEDLKQKGLNIICYTGYYYDFLKNIKQKTFLGYIDVLIDGPFEVDNKIELPFRGSSNQNILPLTEKGKELLKTNKKE